MGLVAQWATDENFSHGFLIPPVALCFAWQRRAALKAVHRQPSGWGLPVAALAICMWLWERRPRSSSSLACPW